VSHDPEPPTRRLDPERASTIRETEYVEGPTREELLDRLRSLRTALAIVGVLAIAALGVALYSLLSEDDDGDTRQGASPARVSALEDQVDELDNRVDDRATKNSVDELRADQQDLEEQVKQAGSSDDSEQLQQSVDQLNDDIQALEQRVDDLAAQQGGATTEP